jgi:hypothetical protein
VTGDVYARLIAALLDHAERDDTTKNGRTKNGCTRFGCVAWELIVDPDLT